MTSLYLIAYDVADPRRLGRVARLLEDHGRRVQKSLFECWLDGNALRALRTRLAALIAPGEDNLRIYRLCATCRAWSESPPLTPPTPGYWIAGEPVQPSPRHIFDERADA